MKNDTHKNKNRRSTLRLDQNLEVRLLAYLVAAGGGLCTSVQACEAQIIYTRANIPMSEAVDGGGPAFTKLDMNNDGTPDFVFTNYSYATLGQGHRYLKISPSVPGNEIFQVNSNGRPFAAALPSGAKVGSAGNFQSDPNGLSMASQIYRTSFRQSAGSWGKIEFGFLGLKFLINGQIHYGWARVKFIRPQIFGQGSISGYAYEATPNQPIITGQTQGTADENTASTERSASHTQSLGMLAAGISRVKIQQTNPVGLPSR